MLFQTNFIQQEEASGEQETFKHVYCKNCTKEGNTILHTSTLKWTFSFSNISCNNNTVPILIRLKDL